MNAREELVSFAVKAAHDLNNTVAALTMAVELAIDVLPEGSDEDLTDLLERVQRSAVKLGATVDGLPAAAEDWPLAD
jgi:signal transduction histidine kinase